MKKLREDIRKVCLSNKEKVRCIEGKHEEINQMIHYFEKISTIIETC
jgi:hypothetical protein